MPLHLDPIGAEVAWPNATSNVFDFIPPINGTYEVYVRVTDAENQTTCHPVGFGLWVYVLPLAESSTQPAQQTLMLLTPENVTYKTSDVPLNFTVDHPTAKTYYSVDNQANDTIDGNTTIPSVANGIHNLTLYVEDFAGMCASATSTFTVDVKQAQVSEPADQPSVPLTFWLIIAVLLAVTIAVGVIKKGKSRLTTAKL
jgi:hypothetical protein